MAKEITDGNGNHQCEVSFSFNKYNKPKLLDLKTSVANTIINALFMVPGNNPSNPQAGVDINSYFYKYEDSINSEDIQTALTNTCGSLPGGATITSVNFSCIDVTNSTVFLLLVRLSIPREDDTALGVVFKRVSTEQDVINFNFEYVDI